MKNSNSNNDIHLEQNYWEYLSLGLYLVLIFEIIFFVLINQAIFSITLAVMLIVMLWVRRIYVSASSSKLDTFRYLLSSIINQNDENNKVRIQNYENSNVSMLNELKYDEIEILYSEENLQKVKSLRKIGIDGILVLLFLAKNSPKLCDSKTIIANLKLPTSTIYRNLNQLNDMQLVISSLTIENPVKTYYQISELGFLYINDLNEIILSVQE